MYIYIYIVRPQGRGTYAVKRNRCFLRSVYYIIFSKITTLYYK